MQSLLTQSHLPSEIVVIDGSGDNATRELVERLAGQHHPVQLRWKRANCVGAASQRNQGVVMCSYPFIGFCDDDIILEESCFVRLWTALHEDIGLGGVNAMITNQKYQSPGRVSRMMLTLLNGRRLTSFAGRVIGPAVNLLPEDRADLPEVTKVEWLNLGCTMYRRVALPIPAFDLVFSGYSLMEDLALSLRVGRNWGLANVRTARILHDSQPGTHKSDVRAIAEMALINRYYVMTKIMRRSRL